MKHLLYELNNSEAFEDALSSIRAEIASYAANSVLIHAYCGYAPSESSLDNLELMNRIIERVRTDLPQAQVIGLSSGGEICRSDIVEPCVLLSAFLFQSSWVKVLPYPNVPSREEDVGLLLFEDIKMYPDVRGVEILFAGNNIDSVPIYESLMMSEPGLTFFGGYAVEHDPIKEPAFLVTNGGVLHDSMVAVIYGGEELHIDAGRTTGWKPLGSTFRVTEARGRRLYSVNGIPAWDLYNRFLRLPESNNIRKYTTEFPLMLLKGKMRLLRHPQEKFDDSSLLLDGRVTVGDEICLSYGAPLEIIHKMNARCERIRSFEPEAILVFSCQGRKNYWGDLVSWEMEPFQKVAETSGACLDGQIMRNNQTGRVIEHRLTLLSIAFREGDKAGREIPAIEIDDAALKGKMSLVHRMSALIESTMEELQKTNEALISMNERLARANDELHRIAITDELTGLYNRREIERRIKAALERARTDNRTISLVMLDIDFFKKVNDTYGHDVGDIVLKEVSAILEEYTDESSGESVGRWGGEEFFMILPGKDMSEALEVAERIRKAVERHDFPQTRHLTISMGAICADTNSNYQAILIKVDQALYEAKQGGRNRVVAVAYGA